MICRIIYVNEDNDLSIFTQKQFLLKTVIFSIPGEKRGRK